MDSKKSDSSREVGESENSLYDLLDAKNLNSLSSLDANLRDSSSSSVSAFDSFAADGQGLTSEDALRSGGASLHISEGEDFRNAASILDGSRSEDAYNDVYRSVTGVDFASQHSAALGGMHALDQPFELAQPGIKGSGANLAEPAPRIFSRVQLAHSHLYIACPLKDLVRKLNSNFERLGADTMFEESSCFWRCMFYPSEPTQAAVDFRVYVNSTPNLGGNNRYLVEFVRREGCAMAFNELFCEIRAAFLYDSKLTDEEGRFCKTLDDLPTPFRSKDIAWASASRQTDEDASKMQPMPFLSRSVSTASNSDSARFVTDFGDSDEDDDDDDVFGRKLDISDKELFQPLFRMAESSFEDVHVQGLALVALECRKKSKSQSELSHCARLVAACPGLIGLLEKRLSASTNPECRRHAASALSMCAQDKSLHESLVTSLGPLAEAAAVDYNIATAEIQRQAAEALCHVCSCGDDATVAHVLGAVADKAAKFAALAKSSGDARLVEAISQVQQRLS